MLTEVVGLALLAALSPTALLVVAVFLGAANARRTVLIYLAGAIVMTAVMATIVFLVLRAGHLYKPHQRQARYGLRLGLGLLLLLFSGFAWRRSKRKPDPAKAAKEKKPGLINRMIARPGPKEAFLVGLLVYSPSVTFIAAVQTVATSKDSVGADVALLVLVIVITLSFVWLPFALYVLMPERTGRLLRSFNSWLRSHGRQIGTGALFVAGVVLTVDGIAGLT
jgi:threonine/homoserine/homoserine lactone efflux protein